MLRERFDADGFTGIPQVLPLEECEPLAEMLTALGSDSAGTRCLLAEDWCRALAQRLRAHAGIAQLLPAHFAAVPCTYVEKSVERNWLVPGTHRHGRIGAEDASRYRQAGPVVACTMERGDALAMRPLVLHASSKADGGSRRLVLHFVFGPRDLPFGLAWQRAV